MCRCRTSPARTTNSTGSPTIHCKACVWREAYTGAMAQIKAFTFWHSAGMGDNLRDAALLAEYPGARPDRGHLPDATYAAGGVWQVPPVPRDWRNRGTDGSDRGSPRAWVTARCASH